MRTRESIWKPKFLAALRNSANMRVACEAAGINYSTPYALRKRRPDFAKEWDEAIEEAIDTLEAAAWKRARDGTRREEPVFYQGQQVGSKFITEYSDTLMVLLLKSHRPAKYRENVKMDVTVTDERDLAHSTAEQAIAGLLRRCKIPETDWNTPETREFAIKELLSNPEALQPEQAEYLRGLGVQVDSRTVS